MIRKVFWVGLVLYWSSTVDAVPLESLCQSAVFHYKNLHEINSVHRVKFNTTLERVGDHMIDVELDFTR